MKSNYPTGTTKWPDLYNVQQYIKFVLVNKLTVFFTLNVHVLVFVSLSAEISLSNLTLRGTTNWSGKEWVTALYNALRFATSTHHK